MICKLFFRDYISQAIAVGLDICKEDLSPTLSKMIGFSVTMLILACNMINVKIAVKLQVSNFVFVLKILKVEQCYSILF